LWRKDYLGQADRKKLRQASFSSAIIASTRTADSVPADNGPTIVTLEAGDSLTVEKVVEHAWLDHVEPAVTVHHSDHHGAPHTFEFYKLYHIFGDFFKELANYSHVYRIS
jgi:hypothetical protein